MAKGKLTRVPIQALNEALSIKEEEGCPTIAEAFRRMAKYSPVGREINNLTPKKFIKNVIVRGSKPRK